MVINWLFFALNALLTAKNLKDGTEHGINALDTVALNLFCVTIPLNYLLNVRRMRWYPAAIAASFSGGSIAYIFLKYYPKGAMLLNQWSLVFSACYALPIFLLLAKWQVDAMSEDAAKLDKLMQVIEDLDKDGDGEVSKKELKAVFYDLFPGASFEDVWDKLDSDGSGSLTIKELANYFGFGHLVEGTAEEEEAEIKKLQGGVGSMAEIEAQLEELSQSELSGTAGGVMSYFLIWDLGVLVSLFAAILYHTKQYAWDSWQISTSLYFIKMVYGLSAFPFLLFKLPLITDALTHTRTTAYDRSGACVAKIPSAEVKRRFADKHIKYVMGGGDEDGDGKIDCYEQITIWWDGFLGPSFTPEQTYKMIDKKYGSKVSAKYKPYTPPKEPSTLTRRFSITDGKKPEPTKNGVAFAPKDMV